MAIDADSDEDPTPIWHVQAWIWGCLLYVIGNGLQFFSYAFAAQTLLLAMSSVQFATHLVSARLVEGIVVPWRCIYAAAIVIGANVLLICFSSKSSKLLDAKELIDLHRYGCLLPRLMFAWPACMQQFDLSSGGHIRANCLKAMLHFIHYLFQFMCLFHLLISTLWMFG